MPSGSAGEPQGYAVGTISFDDFQEFDPLAVDDEVIDQQNMDDDNPIDTIDYPTMRNMPEEMRREAVYTPERQGGVRNALMQLIDHNPGRRPVLLAIIGWCADGCATSELSKKVSAMQEDNRSVYAPTTLCRMLERAGGLRLEMPEIVNECEDAEAGVGYLEIKERVDPVWRATDEGLAARDELTGGAMFRSIVLDRDRRYLEVYQAVMSAVAERPRSKEEIETLVDAFPSVQHPRRFGGHFIDMLERSDALTWRNRAWCLTDLGSALLPEVNAAMAKEPDGSPVAVAGVEA